MKKTQLKEIIKEIIKETLAEPGTKEKEEVETAPKPRRRTLRPPSESPNTKPKALMKEEEKELVNKIAKRFKSLNK